MNQPNSERRQLQAVVVGSGGQGLRRAQALRLSRGWQLSGVVDSNPGVLGSAARRLACATSTSLKQMLESCPCDLVVIATPPAFHNEAIEECINAGKHILCEKPLTIDLQKTRELIEAADRKNLVFATGFNHRFYGPVMDALELVKSGRIGEIRNIDASMGQKPPEELLKAWLGRPEISGGGVLTDNGSHLVDLIRLFAGGITTFDQTSSEFSVEYPGIETRLETRFQCESGINGRLLCSWTGENRNYLTIEIQGTSGSIEISAFPWRLKWRTPAGQSGSRNYLKDRILMKCMGLRAPGLEMSLLREFAILRSMLAAGDHQMRSSLAASALDGLRVAECVELLRSNMIGLQEQNSILAMSGQKDEKIWAKSA